MHNQGATDACGAAPHADLDRRYDAGSSVSNELARLTIRRGLHRRDIEQQTRLLPAACRDKGRCESVPCAVGSINVVRWTYSVHPVFLGPPCCRC